MYTIIIEADDRDIRCSGLTREEALDFIEAFARETCDIWVSFDGGPAWEYSDYPWL